MSEAQSDARTSVIPWIMRHDLELYPSEDSHGHWTIRDPVRLTYFRVESEELEFLRMLNGRLSLETAVDQLMKRFPDVRFAAASLATFLATAIRAGLLIPMEPGYGRQLAETARRARTTAVSRKALSLISHRFRGIDPTPLLHRLDRSLGWIFQPRVLATAAVFIVVVACLVLSRWSQLVNELPRINDLLTMQSLLSLGLMVILIRVLHELGHGLTCHHYGGECHELGCIVVGVLPLLYCDVSDSWRQRHPGRRMQVAAAGIAVELFLAAVFGLLWLASIPGLLHSLFLNVMLLCSLNTLLINGNPLLRYDGYYVLSDLLRIPNLGPESRNAAFRLFDRFVLGIDTADAASMSTTRSLALALFGIISLLYRLTVLTAILLLVHSILKPWRLEGLTWVLAASAAAGILVSMLRMARQRLPAVRASGRQQVRSLAGLLLATVLPLVGLFWPLPYSIEAPFTLTPGVSIPVYVSTAGYLEDGARYGDTVDSGQPVARLSSPDLELSIAQLEGELQLRKTRVAHLVSMRSTSTTSAMAIPAAEKAVRNIEDRLRALKQKASRLSLRSPVSGILYPPRARRTSGDSPLQQQFWQGTPLVDENRRVWLEEQTLLGWVGDTERLRAAIYVPQQDIEFVQEAAPVRLTFQSRPGIPLQGVVSRIRTQPAESAPVELTATRMLATAESGMTLADTRFPVYVRLDHGQSTIPPLYSTGTAGIECRRTSLATRCWRLLVHTFAFEL